MNYYKFLCSIIIILFFSKNIYSQKNHYEEVIQKHTDWINSKIEEINELLSYSENCKASKDPYPHTIRIALTEFSSLEFLNKNFTLYRHKNKKGTLILPPFAIKSVKSKKILFSKNYNIVLKGFFHFLPAKMLLFYRPYYKKEKIKFYYNRCKPYYIDGKPPHEIVETKLESIIKNGRYVIRLKSK